MAEINPTFGEKEMLHDSLTTQKSLTGLYNTAAGECASAALMNDFLTIQGEEHKLQLELFQEMSKRGWYPTPPAEQQMVAQTKEKFQNTNS